jgi:tetratricopeptide (TPR) repeat protein
MVPRRLFKALLLVAVAAVAADGLAAGEQEQLQQYIAELKAADKDDVIAANPDADAVRKKIFDLVRGMDPKPAVPNEYDDLVGEGTYEFKNARGVLDFITAATSYNRASLAAPWLPEIYFNEGVALEKGREYEAAIRMFNLYLAAAPDASDAREVRQRIGGLRVAARDANRVAAEEYLEKLRPLLFGPYITYLCDGCTVAETARVANWRNSEVRTTIDIEGDDIVVRGSGQLMYRGHPGCFGPLYCVTSWKDADGHDVWGEIHTDGTCTGRPYAHIHISRDRPITGGDDSWRLHYLHFDKPASWC